MSVQKQREIRKNRERERTTKIAWNVLDTNNNAFELVHQANDNDNIRTHTHTRTIAINIKNSMRSLNLRSFSFSYTEWVTR